jgi:hypothetical protein
MISVDEIRLVYHAHLRVVENALDTRLGDHTVLSLRMRETVLFLQRVEAVSAPVCIS